jgi:rare lipoprotein A
LIGIVLVYAAMQQDAVNVVTPGQGPAAASGRAGLGSFIAAVTALVLLVAVPAPGPRVAADDAPPEWSQSGRVSWYGPGFQGRRTANGEIFDTNRYTMAHRTLPFGARVRVTNLENGRTVVLRVNDRGPYVRGRIADLSRAAATDLGFVDEGVVRVRIELI